MHRHPIVLGGGPLLPARVVRGDDDRVVTGVVQVLEDAQHRIRDAVDVRQERLGDDRNSHAASVPGVPIVEVADRNTRHELSSAAA
jgi:hypothetical protein